MSGVKRNFKDVGRDETNHKDVGRMVVSLIFGVEDCTLEYSTCDFALT